jgi:hypothetical protein
VQLQLGIAKPVAKLGDLGAVAVIQVLTRNKYFDLGNAGIPDAIEPNRSKAIIDEQVRR